MEVDLKNLLNMYLLTYTSESFDLPVWCEEQIGGIKCRIYKTQGTLIVTFSPFNCENWLDYLRIGGKLVWQQDMVSCGSAGKMNRFFHNVSREFVKCIREKNPKFSKMIITGMSMGAALGQCFYYHFKPRVQTRIYAFGSPRIGDIRLRNWFENQKKLKITNYALFKLIDNVKRIDPVCLFPSCAYGQYVDNAHMTMIYNRKIVEQAEYFIYGHDTEITPWSVFYNCGLSKKVRKLWDLIHDTDEYYDQLTGHV